jgi:hypothetical protein
LTNFIEIDKIRKSSYILSKVGGKSLEDEEKEIKKLFSKKIDNDNKSSKDKSDIQSKELFKVFLKEKFLEIVLEGGKNCIKKLESIIKQNMRNK